MEDVCRFQMSKFLNGNRDYQVVVRANTIEEFKKAIDEMKTVVEPLEAALPKKEVSSSLDGFCKLHNAHMKSRRGPTGEFWSHYHTDEQGNNWWCNGKKLTPAKNYASN